MPGKPLRQIRRTFCLSHRSESASGSPFCPPGNDPNETPLHKNEKELIMGIGTILIIILILLLVGGLPVFPHSRSWGYGPSGIIGTILVILLILVLLGRI
jgi:hypothetical protein